VCSAPAVHFVEHHIGAEATVIRVLGIDGGISGACAVVALTDSSMLQLIDVIDAPVIGTKSKKRIDVIGLCAWIRSHAPSHAVIERAQGYPKQGISSAFLYGRSIGALEATVACCEIPMMFAEASQWKRFHNLPGKDKEAARALTIQLLPGAHPQLARVKDHNRAEAILIAIYGVKLFNLRETRDAAA
jgi:hypothetical protein